MKSNEKTFEASIDEMVKNVFGAIKLTSNFESFDKAIDMLKDRSIFDATTSQFVVGTVLDFDPAKMKIGIANIGTNGATVLVVPAGTQSADGKITFNRAMTVYLSSLAKTIRVADAEGEPVLLPNNLQKTVTGEGNAVWEALDKLKTEADRLNWLKGKTLKVVEIKRDFGPSNYVNIGGSNVPKGHRLTSLPLFEEL